MALQLPPELEQRVTRIAQEAAREPAEVLAEIVAAWLDEEDDPELAQAIAAGDAEIERGEGIPHEQVIQDMQAIIDRARAQRG